MKRILIADDEGVICRMMEDILGRDYAVTIVHTGREAYQLLTSCRDLYSLAVVDLVMPEWNGHSSVELAAALGCDVPVLYITGYLPNADAPKRADVLYKPFTIEEFVERVEKLISAEPRRFHAEEPL